MCPNPRVGVVIYPAGLTLPRRETLRIDARIGFTADPPPLVHAAVEPCHWICTG